jgi:AcrR family transcriptional regulator
MKVKRNLKEMKEKNGRVDLVEYRRRQILQAAEKVFSEKGYHQTNIADIAQELKIGHGTFYRYFKNKREIFESVVGDIIKRVSLVVSGEDPKSTNTLDEYIRQVRRLGEKLFALFVEDPNVARMLFYESWGLDEEMREKVWEMMGTFGSYTELYLVNGKKKGFLRTDLETEATALAINTLIFEAGRRIAKSEDREKEKKTWMKAVINLMFFGIKK